MPISFGNGARLSMFDPLLSGRLGLRSEIIMVGIPDTAMSTVRSVAADWNVTPSRALAAGTVAFRSGPEGFGQHKRQALRLLYFSLHARAALPGALRAYLHVVYELREAMIAALAGGDRARHERASRVRDWMRSGESVRVEGVLAAGFRQAGIPIGRGEEDLLSGWTEVAEAATRARTSAFVRKAG